MQTEGLNFLKVRKSLRAKSMNECQKEIRVDFQTTKYLVFSMVLKEKMSSI